MQHILPHKAWEEQGLTIPQSPNSDPCAAQATSRKPQPLIFHPTSPHPVLSSIILMGSGVQGDVPKFIQAHQWGGAGPPRCCGQCNSCSYSATQPNPTKLNPPHPIRPVSPSIGLASSMRKLPPQRVVADGGEAVDDDDHPVSTPLT